MRSFLSKQNMVVALSFLALAALMGLAIGLRSMPFRERQVFGQSEAQATSTTSLQIVDAVLSIPIRDQLIFWSLLILLALLIGLLISPEMRKQLIRMVLRMAATYWLLYILARRYHEELAQMALNLTGFNGMPMTDATNNPPMPEFVPPSGSSWLSYALGLMLAGLLIFAFWRGYKIWRDLTTAPPLDELGRIARSSLNDLSSGVDSTDAIMNCYHRMSAVVLEKKQINRQISMTPGEFAARLEQAGLPGEAVQRLTRLFESVRYGGYKTNSTMINEAVACLTTILHYCGEAV